MSAVSFAKMELSPVVDPSRAVAVATSWEAQNGEMRRWTLHGAYRLSGEQARDVAAVPLQRALCVTITAGFRHAAFNLLGKQLCFPDDEEREAGWVKGYFNVDLLARFGLGPHERCFVLVSLGPHLSNVLEVQPGDGPGSA